MAISQISKGVFVVSPDAQKRYQDTAAGEYTSVFTKARANLWEMSKQQALMNIKEAADRNKAEFDLYAAHNAAQDKRLADGDKLLASYLEGRTDADAALQKSARAEETERQRAAIDFRKAGAEQFGLSSGGVSSSTGGTGGGGGKKSGVSTGKVQEFETANRGKTTEEKIANLKEVGGPGGILADLSPEERQQTQIEIIDREQKRNAADLELSGMPAAEADIKAAGDLVDLLSKYDPAMGRAYAARGTGAAATAGETASASSRVDRGQRSAPRYRNLGEMPEVVPIKAELAPSEAAALIAINDRIAEERKLLGLPPKLPPSDYITEARRIAAGRIPGIVGGPRAPFEQQLRLDALLNASPEQIAADRAAFEKSRAAAAPATPPAAPAAPPAAPTAPAVAVEPAAVAAAAAAAATSAGVPAPAAAAAAAAAATAKPPAAPTAAPTAPPEIRPEAADLMTDEEKAQFRADLLSKTTRPRFTGEFVPEVEAFEPDRAVPVTARTAALRAPSIPQRIGIENMLSQRSVSGGGTAKVAPISERMRLRGMSMQPEGYAVPAAEVRPQYIPPLDLDERGNVPPPAGMTADEMRPMKLDTRRGPIAPPPPPASNESKPAAPPPEAPKPTAFRYFQQRYTNAVDLVSKPDKLTRLVASGPNKTVAKIFAANAAKNIPIERAWQEIALQFAGEPEKMHLAHEILLALDIQNDNIRKPKA